MERIRINKKGQITIPKYVRDKYGLAPGFSLTLREGDKRITLEPAVFCHHCGKVLPDEFKETRACPGCPPIRVIRVY